MTIPSRPAPPPPQQRITIKLPPPPNSKTKSTSLSNAFGAASSQGRYGSMNAISWESTSSSTTHSRQVYESIGGRKVPPPRPPPPRVPTSSGGNTVLKKPGPPQSVNVLSNLFGKKKGKPHNSSRNASAIPRVPPPLQQQHQHHPPNLLNFGPKKPISLGSSQSATEAELISFDSPPSSPTLTQKSNSDCVSVDSFSSDSNFSSPNNGSISQPESGFEDDFTTSPVDPWESIIASDSFRGNSPRPSALNAPVRNLNAINRSQNENPLCNGRSLLPPPTALSMPTIIRPKASQNTSPTHSGSSRNLYAMNAIGFSAAIPQSSIAASTFNTSQAKSRAPNVFSLEGSSFDDSHDLDSSFPSLPMPNCPPPPPPPANAAASIPSLDLNGAVFPVDDAEGPSYGIALYDFDSNEEDDLNFKANEKVYILKKLNDEWYLGRNRRGCEGMFPSNYIEIKVPLKDNETEDNLASTMVTNETKLSNKIRAIYNFTAEVPEDLTLHENDLVTVLYRINDEWLYGEVNDQRGQFPANFIEYIPKNLSNQMP